VSAESREFAPPTTSKPADDDVVRGPSPPAITPLPGPEPVAEDGKKTPAPHATPTDLAAQTGAHNAEAVRVESHESAPPTLSEAADDTVLAARTGGAEAGSATKESGKAAPKTASRISEERIAPVPSAPEPTPRQPPDAPGEAAQPAPRAVRADLAAQVGSWKRRLIFGYGLGNYGVIIGATFEAGTHNMFLDAHVASGVPGLVLFSGFWFMMLWRMGREGWRILREGTSPPRESIVPLPSVLLAVFVITVAGVIVNFKFETLGMMLNAAVVWLLIVTLPDRADPATASPGATGGLSLGPRSRAPRRRPGRRATAQPWPPR
jgi:hypothetical protein